MTDVYLQKGRGMRQHDNQQLWSEPRSNNVVKAATAATAGSSFLVLSGLTFAGTVTALTVGSPLLVIFSPVLVPAVITMFLLPTGFLTSGGLGVVATTVLARLYKYVSGGRPTGPDSLNQSTHKQNSTAWEMSQRDEHKIEGDHDTNKNVNYTAGAQGGRHEMVKAVTATTAGGASLILSGLTFAGTVISLTMATPLLVIFSPVLVPAVITVFFLATGFLASGGFAVAASIVLTWMYKYMKGEHPSGSDLLDQVSHSLGSKAQGMSDQRGEHTTGERHYTTGKVDYSTGGDNYAAGDINHSTGGDNYAAGDINHSTGGDNYTTEAEGVIQKLALAATATTVTGPLLLLTGLVLARVVGEISMGIPQILIFSPMLVPAVITLLLTTRGFGVVGKAAAATTVGGTFLILSGWTFARSVFEVVTVTPLLVIFSPVFVPAVITVFLLATGFLASGGFAVAAMTVLTWWYRYVTGGHPTEADSFDHGTHKLGLKVREMMDKVEHSIDDSDRHETSRYIS